MSDWQVGDLAVCVDASPHPLNTNEANEALRQIAVGCCYTFAGFAPNRGIFLAEVCAAYEPDFGWREYRFRRVAKDKREACEPEFVTLLNRIKRSVDA